MKSKWFTPIGLLFFLLLCLVPSGQAQQTPVSQAAGMPWQIGQAFVFSSSSIASGAFNAKGILYWKLIFVPDGTVSSCSVSLDSSATGSSFSIGGIVSSATIGSCASAGNYVTSTAVTPTNFGQLTPTITGTGHVTLVLFGYTENPALSSGAASNVNITNSSLPLPTGAATAANQAAPGTAGTPGSQVSSIQGITGMTPVKTDGSGVTQPVSLATAPTTPTQPAGFSAGIDFNQTVTTSAVALASNASHSFSVCAYWENTTSIFVGPSGVTTSGSTKGTELQPGQCAGWLLNNTNLRYVIATGSGQSVNVTGS
jgi:hypothetical protein